MQRQTIETLLGAVVLLIGIGFITIAFSSSGVSTSQGYRLIAEFDDASGVQTGTEVRMSGIRVGQVTGKRLDQEFYLAVYNMYEPLWNKLTAEASQKIRLGNYTRLFDEARKKVRQWEGQNIE